MHGERSQKFVFLLSILSTDNQIITEDVQIVGGGGLINVSSGVIENRKIEPTVVVYIVTFVLDAICFGARKCFRFSGRTAVRVCETLPRSTNNIHKKIYFVLAGVHVRGVVLTDRGLTYIIISYGVGGGRKSILSDKILFSCTRDVKVKRHFRTGSFAH